MKNVILAVMVLANNILNPAHKLFGTEAKLKRKGMALVKFGGGVVGMSGSIAGNTFARNRYGSYVRSRTVPVNPNSTLQQEIRAIMSTVRDAWFETLTTAQRAAWAVYAANVQVPNRLGESINLTGYNMFCRTNLAALYNGATLIDDAPATYSLAEQDETVAVTLTAATGATSVAFNDALDWLDETGGYLLVYESAPQNPTVNFFKGPYRQLGTVDGDSVTPPTTPASFTSQHTLTAGQKVFYQFRILRADGRLSEPFRTSAIAG